MMRFVNLAIVGPLDLTSHEITRSAVFVNCTLGSVNARYLKARSSLRFIDCTIDSWDGVGTTSDSELSFVGCTIHTCTQVGARIARAFVAKKSYIHTLELSGACCEHDVILDYSRFDTVSIDGLEAENGLSMTRVRAKRINAVDLRTEVLYAADLVCPEVNLDRAQISGDAKFEGARVADKFSLEGADIGAKLDLGRARIGDLTLTRARCPQLLLNDIVVFRRMTVRYCEIGTLQLKGKIFSDLRLFDNRFSGLFVTRGIYVHGRTSMERNRIAGTLSIAHSDVANYFREAASFANTVCVGQLNVEAAKFGGDLSLIASRAFDILLINCTIGGNMVFRNTHADQTISTQGSSMASLDLRALRAARVSLISTRARGKVYLDNARVDGSIDAEDFQADSFDMSFASVAGSASFGRASVAKSFTMIRSDVGHLAFESNVAEHGGTFRYPEAVVLRDTRYGSIGTAWRPLLDHLLATSPFDSTAPAMLERTFRTIGRSDWADSVYFATRKRAASELKNRSARAAQHALEWIGGYGVQPSRLIVTALFVVAAMIGFLSFGFYHGSIVPEPPLATRSRVGLAILETFDVIVRGEKSNLFDAQSFHAYSAEAQSVALAVLALRYVVLGLIGVWLAYLTGLIAYVGSTRR